MSYRYTDEEIAALNADNDRMRAALKPFALDADEIDAWAKTAIGPQTPTYKVTHDDFRRARAAINGHGGVACD